MEDIKTINQRKLGVKLSFQFGEEKLTRTISDYSGENQVSIPYQAIDTDNVSKLAVNHTRRFLRPVTVAALGVALVSYSLTRDPVIHTIVNSIAACIIIGFWLANYFKVLAIRYTILPVFQKGSNIKVMTDQNHDAILEQIKTRRIAQLRKLYAAINTSNDPAKELQKFKWLKDHAVITEQDYQDAVAKIRAAQPVSPDAAAKNAQPDKGYLN